MWQQKTRTICHWSVLFKLKTQTCLQKSLDFLHQDPPRSATRPSYAPFAGLLLAVLCQGKRVYNANFVFHCLCCSCTLKVNLC